MNGDRAKIETRRGPCVLTMPSGRRFTTERVTLSYDDWRETLFGPVNFGMVYMIGQRRVELDG